MTHVIEISIIALLPGTAEGILAVAIVLLYLRTRVVNVFLGAAGALGAFLVASLSGRLGVLPALIIGLAVCVAASTLITIGVARVPLITWRAVPSALTLVAAVVLEQVLTGLWSRGLEFPELFPQELIPIGHYALTPLHLAGMFGGLIAVLLAFAVLRLTPRGSEAGDFPAATRHATWAGVGAVASLLASILAFTASSLSAEVAFGPGYMVAPAVVAILAAAIALFRRPEIAFLAAVSIEVARNLSLRYDLPHAGYTSGIAIVAALAAGAYALWYLLFQRLRAAA